MNGLCMTRLQTSRPLLIRTKERGNLTRPTSTYNGKEGKGHGHVVDLAWRSTQSSHVVFQRRFGLNPLFLFTLKTTDSAEPLQRSAKHQLPLPRTDHRGTRALLPRSPFVHLNLLQILRCVTIRSAPFLQAITPAHFLSHPLRHSRSSYC